jgi:hypothetical protein
MEATQREGEWEVGDEVRIRFWCEAAWAATLTDWDAVQKLAPVHIWSEALVRERFDCGDVRQIHCALVRVFALPRDWVIPYERKYGGCRTWVELPAPDAHMTAGLAPVLADEEFAAQRARIETMVGLG